MTQIKLNDYVCEIDSYNRNTTISGGVLSSNGYINLVNGNASELNELLGTPVTDIEITVDNEKIYELHDIDAEINSMNEYLSGNRMAYNLNIVFNFNT